MKIVKAYSTQMSYDISSDKKIKAEKSLLYFNHAIKILDTAKNHLNLISTPFKENPQMNPDDIMNVRTSLRRFRDKSIENFNEFKKVSFQCVNIMQEFASDTQTIKLMQSFVSSIDDLESKVNDFVDLFQNMESKEFSKDIVDAVESIQTQCDETEEIIDDRIKAHIQSNILAKNWVDSVSDDLQVELQKKTPLIMKLFDDRQNELNNKIKDNE